MKTSKSNGGKGKYILSSENALKSKMTMKSTKFSDKMTTASEITGNTFAFG